MQTSRRHRIRRSLEYIDLKVRIITKIEMPFHPGGPLYCSPFLIILTKRRREKVS